jgi:3',5'-cyclic AMP phosphodiesterase CpdA
MIIAQISDTHIREEGHLAYRRIDTAGFLGRAVEHLARLVPPPDVVLVTGDLVDAGRPEEYRHLRRLLAPLSMPVYLIPGNHDDREALREVFADHHYLPRRGFLQYVVEGHPVRLVALDTLLPGQGGGLLCAERLAWLESRLAEAPGRVTLILLHHPPFRTGIWHMDRLGLEGADAMGAIVARHPQVERVVAGHLHRAIQFRWHGTLASTAPSTAHQVVLDFREDGPAAWALEPPGFQLHVWRADTGLVTHTCPIGDFAGPYPFRDLVPSPA